MFVAKLRITTLFLLAVGCIGITTGMAYQAVLGQESQSQQQEKETAVTKGGARNPRLANTPQAALPKSDKEKVQGLWRVVSVEFNGQEVTKDLGEMKWAFKGEQMTYSLKFLPEDIRITFKLESKENPKSVDFILKSASQAETMKGIYELKDDELKVCIHVQAARAQERPAEFKTKSDSNLCLFVLKREKDHTNQVPNKEERQATGKSPDSTKAAAKAPYKANGIIYLVNEELMIVPPDGKDVTRLPTKAKRMFWLQVSPNGKQLAYTAVVNGKFKGYVTDLFSEPSLISKVARLADIPEGDSLDGEVDYCRWSADGKKLACFEGLGMQGFPLGKAATTWIVDIKTGEKADFNLPNGHFLQDWSPDGNWFLTFKQDKSTENEFIPRVYLVKRDSSEVRRLSSDNQLAWSARFSPDGRRALFVSLGRQSQVHVVDLADGKPRPVSPELNAVVHSACWSPDGKRIAYAWQQRRVNPEDDQTEYVLSVIDQDGKNPATLRTDKGRDGPPVHVDWR